MKLVIDVNEIIRTSIFSLITCWFVSISILFFHFKELQQIVHVHSYTLYLQIYPMSFYFLLIVWRCYWSFFIYNLDSIILWWYTSGPIFSLYHIDSRSIIFYHTLLSTHPVQSTGVGGGPSSIIKKTWGYVKEFFMFSVCELIGVKTTYIYIYECTRGLHTSKVCQLKLLMQE